MSLLLLFRCCKYQCGNWKLETQQLLATIDFSRRNSVIGGIKVIHDINRENALQEETNFLSVFL